MTDENQTGGQAAQAGQQPQQPQLALQRIYIKDVSFEAPRGHEAFAAEWKPEVNMDMNMGRKQLSSDNWEVVLSLTLTVKNAGETAFLVEVHQGGIFLCQGFDEDQLRQVLNTACANILFPYAREAIDSLVIKGGFPPLMLAPINFDALYMQAMNQRAQQAQQAESQPN
jgi:preprotein translocase subunit SecB